MADSGSASHPLDAYNLPSVTGIRKGSWQPNVTFVDEWRYRGILILKLVVRRNRYTPKTISVLVVGQTKSSNDVPPAESQEPVLVTLRKYRYRGRQKGTTISHGKEMYADQPNQALPSPHSDHVDFCEGLNSKLGINDQHKARHAMVHEISGEVTNDVDFKDEKWVKSMKETIDRHSNFQESHNNTRPLPPATLPPGRATLTPGSATLPTGSVNLPPRMPHDTP